jgi:hypothetical protein
VISEDDVPALQRQAERAHLEDARDAIDEKLAQLEEPPA